MPRRKNQTGGTRPKQLAVADDSGQADGAAPLHQTVRAASQIPRAVQARISDGRQGGDELVPPRQS